MTTLSVEVPEELIAIIGSPDEAAAKAREALVLGLLREGRLSQGQASRLLGVTRWDVLDLMAEHAIASGPETADEMQVEIETARRTAGRP